MDHSGENEVLIVKGRTGVPLLRVPSQEISRACIGFILGVYLDNGKENGNTGAFGAYIIKEHLL